MSAELEAEGAADKCCANCGKAEIDDVKLKDCDKCDLARYCGDECQQNHREVHEAICKERAARLNILFRQNESSHLGDCPICFLPLPLDAQKFKLYFCCCKEICLGCARANHMREKEARQNYKCPFCRKRLPSIKELGNEILMDRAEANDPIALRHIGTFKSKGGDYDGAFEYLTRAAELGDAEAHFGLSYMYHKGNGVEKDEKMTVHHWEEAAIAGHPIARRNLGCHEGNNKRFDRAVKHWIIAANLGHDDSLQMLKEGYKYGVVSKDDLAKALRAHHAAVSAMKSPQRAEVAAAAIAAAAALEQEL